MRFECSFWSTGEIKVDAETEKEAYEKIDKGDYEIVYDSGREGIVEGSLWRIIGIED